jgi:intein/homing endonuclease
MDREDEMRVKLTYFKAWNGLGGKYYSEGEYVSEKDHYFDVVEEVRKMHKEGRLPDLVEGHSPYHVLVTTEPETAPHLLIAPYFINPKEQA